MSLYVPIPGSSVEVAFTTVTTVAANLDNTKIDGQALYQIEVTGAGWFCQGLPTLTFTTDGVSNICIAAGAGPVVTGMGPVQVSSTVTLPTGLSAATNYWLVDSVGIANGFKLATSYANAIAGTAITISSAGSGVHTVDTVATVSNGNLLIQANTVKTLDGRMGQKVSIIQDSSGGKASLCRICPSR